ncbi:MAG: hypothetical protein EBT06_08945 [Gammaproteobacteria bacterium]|nr:hypothetical protein [Gammaproteobacteria bacterium]NBY24011.1 hypothetical protein [Gammaproteobacteria bacterium]NDG87076.1 hypothetical protein [Gammaproteobacteria bacterium]
MGYPFKRQGPLHSFHWGVGFILKGARFRIEDFLGRGRRFLLKSALGGIFVGHLPQQRRFFWV